jgi:hypothetical protein
MTRTGKAAIEGYSGILAEVICLLESARSASARSVNAIMTVMYWEIGRRIVEFEQHGKKTRRLRGGLDEAPLP